MKPIIITLLLASAASGAALDEVNLWRRANGLRPYIEDPALTEFAMKKAIWRAQHLAYDGHQGPKNPPGTCEGTGETAESWGCWNTCIMEESHVFAGAAVVRNDHGQRVMVLVCRGGSCHAPRGRNIRPVRTFHLTPNPPRVPAIGRR